MYNSSVHFCTLDVQCTKMYTSFGAGMFSTEFLRDDVHWMCSVQKCTLHIQCTSNHFLVIFGRQKKLKCPLLENKKEGIQTCRARKEKKQCVPSTSLCWNARFFPEFLSNSIAIAAYTKFLRVGLQIPSWRHERMGVEVRF